MNKVRGLLALMLMLGVAGLVSAQKDEKKEEGKVDAALIVGKWEAVKLGGNSLPKGLTMNMEFTKDGKAIMMAEFNGMGKSKEGSYKVAGNKLTLTENAAKKEETLTIKTLNKETLILENEGKGKGGELEFKKK